MTELSLLGVAQSWLERRERTWKRDEDVEGVVLAITKENTEEPWLHYLQVREDHRQIALFAILEKEVPPERRSAMAELVLRASFGLTVGTFELDLDDGQLRFRTSVGLGSTEMEGAQLSGLLDEMYRTTWSMERGYWTAITAVLDGEGAAGAVQSVEG